MDKIVTAPVGSGQGTLFVCLFTLFATSHIYRLFVAFVCLVTSAMLSGQGRSANCQVQL